VIAHWDDLEPSIVHRIGEESHTLIGGPDGLDVLALGERSIPPITWLPRPRVVRAGVVTVTAGQLHAPPHCHSAEEETFVVLEGDGALELTPSPRALDDDAQAETHPVRAEHAVSRLRGTRIAHAFRAGPAGLTLLADGTRDPNDIAYYPRSNKIFFRGVGLIARPDHVVYETGEESTV